MVNTYLYAVDDAEDGLLYIDSVKAKNYKDAQNQLIKRYADKYEEIPYPADYKDLIKSLEDINVYLGDLVEIDEFM